MSYDVCKHGDWLCQPELLCEQCQQEVDDRKRVLQWAQEWQSQQDGEGQLNQSLPPAPARNVDGL